MAFSTPCTSTRSRPLGALEGLAWSLTLVLLLCGGCRRSSSGSDASSQTQGRGSATPDVASPTTRSSGSALTDAAPRVPNAADSSAQHPSHSTAPNSVTGGSVAATVSLSDLPHYLPSTATTARKRPLLLFLHGFGSDGATAFKVLGLTELGRKHELFVVAPDGSRDPQSRRFWNAHPACCNFGDDKIDHVRYLSTLVDQVSVTYPVDTSRLYVVGFSNGGFMAHRLACEWGERLRGIASVAGAGPDASIACKTPKTLRVLEMHGDADPTVFYAGGTLFDRQGFTYGSAMNTFTDWGKRLDCVGDPVSHGFLDLDPRLPGEETTILTYRRCARGTASLWTVRGGSHMVGNRPSVMEKVWQFLNSDSP